MEYKRFGDKIVLRVERGEEIVSSIKAVCEKENVAFAEISGIGAASETEIGIFNVDKKEYFSKVYSGLYEISSICGNVSKMNGECYLHLHITIGNVKDNCCYAGHLTRAVIGATAEIIITVIDGSVSRQFNTDVGLNLLSF